MKQIKAALKPVLATALREGGQAIGGMTGTPYGAKAGRYIGKRISQLLGSGDYETNEVAVNSLINPNGARPSSTFGSDSMAVMLRRREFIGDIKTHPTTAGAFYNNTFSINPGLRTTFPFLSQVAANYEEYCFDGVVFEFIGSASPYLATSALGTVIASMEYNASAPPFATKYTMENSSLAVSTRLDRNLMYGVECAVGSNVQNCYYTRNGDSSLPLTTTDLGTFQLAVAPGAGVPANTVVGELWVTYDVCLKRPILDPSRVGVCSITRTFAGSCNAAPLGTSASTYGTAGSLSSFSVNSTSLTFTNMVVGEVIQISVSWTGSAAAAYVVPAITPTGGVAFAGYRGGGSTAVASPAASVVTTLASVDAMFKCTDTTLVLTFGTSGTLPSGGGDVSITAVNLGYGYSDYSF